MNKLIIKRLETYFVFSVFCWTMMWKWQENIFCPDIKCGKWDVRLTYMDGFREQPEKNEPWKSYDYAKEKEEMNADCMKTRPWLRWDTSLREQDFLCRRGRKGIGPCPERNPRRLTLLSDRGNCVCSPDEAVAGGWLGLFLARGKTCLCVSERA